MKQPKLMFASTTINLSKQQYVLLGKLLHQKKPHIADEIISTWFPKQDPTEQDLTRIGPLFYAFCALQNLIPEDHIGPVFKTSKVNIRRLFVAVMIHLYNPDVFSQPIDNIILKKGFVRQLSQVLKLKDANISLMIREVIMWEKQYEDFAASVSFVINEISTNGSTEE
jgi:hypothetical protein